MILEITEFISCILFKMLYDIRLVIFLRFFANRHYSAARLSVLIVSQPTFLLQLPYLPTYKAILLSPWLSSLKFLLPQLATISNCGANVGQLTWLSEYTYLFDSPLCGCQFHLGSESHFDPSTSLYVLGCMFGCTFGCTSLANLPYTHLNFFIHQCQKLDLGDMHSKARNKRI